MHHAELVVALDTQDMEVVRELAHSLRHRVSWFKVGLELFVQAGPAVVQFLKEHGFKIFLDLKMYDIPNTVYGGVLSATRMGVDMMTIHVQGGEQMAKAALKAAYEGRQYAQDGVATAQNTPLIMGVTVLTSMAQGDLPLSNEPVASLVTDLAQKAHTWGLDGIVSSGHEVSAIKNLCGSQFLCLTPGIRLQDTSVEDQKRVVTPHMATKAGADFLVVGRPITQAKDPALAVRAILQDMQ